jgi:adenosine deaminase
MPIDQHGDTKLQGLSLRGLPKISLHDHLDGGVRPETIIELGDEIGLELPESDGTALADWFAQKSDSGSLVEYLKTFDLTTAVMQTPEGLTRVAREFVEDLAADGVIYGEVRWAPEQHLAGGLSLEEAVEAVQEGIEEGEDAVSGTGRDIRVGQLITAMRHTDRSLEIAELAVDFRGRGAVGFDIAGPEDGFLPSRHRAAFDYLASEFFPTTVHAGEAAGLESIRSAIIDGRALRLGHGVRIAQDLEIISRAGDEVLVQFGDLARAVALLEPADRRGRGVGRGARRPPVRSAVPARLLGHRERGQPHDEPDLAHARAGALGRRVRVRPGRPRDLPAQRRRRCIPPDRGAGGAHRAHRRGLRAVVRAQRLRNSTDLMVHGPIRTALRFRRDESVEFCRFGRGPCATMAFMSSTTEGIR